MSLNSIARIWSRSQYENVKLPGLGELTCGDVANMLRTLPVNALRTDPSTVKRINDKLLSLGI